MSRNKPPLKRSNSPSAINHPSPQQGQARLQQWSGPLPPPAALDQFNEIIPNGAERIMSMIEREQAHRIEHEATGLRATIQDTRRTHWMGVAISLTAISGSVISVILHAHPAVSVALVGVPIVAMINALIKSKSTK